MKRTKKKLISVKVVILILVLLSLSLGVYNYFQTKQLKKDLDWMQKEQDLMIELKMFPDITKNPAL